jgi:DNA-binding XRE family transcriptional regulator
VYLYQTGLYESSLQNGWMRNPIHHPRYTIFREMLKEARVTAGLTQEQVADGLGERRLDYTEVLEIADVIGFDIADFTKRYRAALRKQAR